MGTGTVDPGKWGGVILRYSIRTGAIQRGGADIQTQTVSGHAHQGSLLFIRDMALASDRGHTSRPRQGNSYRVDNTGAPNTGLPEQVQPGGQAGPRGD